MAKTNELQLKIPTFHSVTRSFSRKIQVKQFEPMDVFSSHGMQIPEEEATPEKIGEVSAQLFNLAKQDVEKDIENYLNSPKEGSLTEEDLKTASKYIKTYTNGGSLDDFSKQVTDDKEKLNDKVLEFLRNFRDAIK